MYAHYLRTRHVAAVPAATDVILDNRGSALWKRASGCSGFLMLWNTGLTALMVELADWLDRFYISHRSYRAAQGWQGSESAAILPSSS